MESVQCVDGRDARIAVALAQAQRNHSAKAGVCTDAHKVPCLWLSDMARHKTELRAADCKDLVSLQTNCDAKQLLLDQAACDLYESAVANCSAQAT